MGISSKQISKLFASDGSYNTISSPPTHLSGATGDKMGMFAYDSNNSYYCTQDFTPYVSYNVTAFISYLGGTTTLSNGSPGFIVYVGSGYVFPTQPQTGWTVGFDGNTYQFYDVQDLGFSVAFTFYGPFGTDYSALQTYLFANPTAPFTLSSSLMDIWKKSEWGSLKPTYGVYEALLTQTSTITGNAINYFNYGLIIGEEYKITSYSSGDDFSNVANVISGTINQTGCIFIATGATPSIWTHGSTLHSSGNFVAHVLENTLGFDIDWLIAPFGGYGYYVGVNNTSGPATDAFPREKTFAVIANKYPINNGNNFPPQITIQTSSFMNKDNIILINVYDNSSNDLSNNELYYTPVQIKIKN